jgi:Ca2+/H+ antiporter
MAMVINDVDFTKGYGYGYDMGTDMVKIIIKETLSLVNYSVKNKIKATSKEVAFIFIIIYLIVFASQLRKHKSLPALLTFSESTKPNIGILINESE